MRIENKTAISIGLSRSTTALRPVFENHPSSSGGRVPALSEKSAHTYPPNCLHLARSVQDTDRRVEPASLGQRVEAGWRTCSRCRRSLPPSEFYHRVGRKPDHYCKPCRVEDSRLRYRRKAHARWVEARPGGTLVEVTDREERLLLIRRALQVVRQSVEARSRKRRMAEFLAER